MGPAQALLSGRVLSFQEGGAGVRSEVVFGLVLVAAVVLSLPIKFAYSQTLPDGTTVGALPGSATLPDYTAATLSEIDPGHTTQAEVKALLGPPWRDTNESRGYADADIWEYRGQDADGTYRIHIDFNGQNIVTLIAKIPDKTGVSVWSRAAAGFNASPPRAPANDSWPWD